MINMMRVCVLAALVLGLTGCGYHFGSGTSLTKDYRTISVPYVDNDSNGDLTRCLIQQVAESGAWSFLSDDADLILKVAIVDTRHQHIGFRYGQAANGRRETHLVPSEDRVSVLSKVEVIEASTQKVLIEPTYISASVYVDYDPEIDEDHLLSFSMGQLDFIDTARKISLDPLYHSLADKIVDYIVNSW